VIDLERFGRELSRLRVCAGLKTHDAAARQSGIERATIVRHEKGTGGVPRSETLMRYEDAYGIERGSLTNVLYGVGQAVSQSAPRSAPVASRGTTDALRSLRLVQNDVERELIEAGAAEDRLAEANRLFAEASRGLRVLLGRDTSAPEDQQAGPNVAAALARVLETDAGTLITGVQRAPDPDAEADDEHHAYTEEEIKEATRQADRIDAARARQKAKKAADPKPGRRAGGHR
jgi:hypothetical protein